MRYTTYLKFADEAGAIAALPAYHSAEDGWDDSCVDANVPVRDASGNLVPGFFVHILSVARLPEVEGLAGWTGTASDQSGQWALIAGTAPHTPTRVFA